MAKTSKATIPKPRIFMRNMSFSLTTEQIKYRLKTVTRRLGWADLKPGTRLQACRKCMGLKPGEKVEKLAVIEIVSNRSEPLHAITDEEVWLEGFNMPAHEFIEMFCEHMGCTRDTLVNRIEFKYVEESPS